MTGHYAPRGHLQLDSTHKASPDKLSYTITEVCVATGLGRTSIYEAIGRGALKSIRACGRRLVRKADLEAWLASFDSMR